MLGIPSSRPSPSAPVGPHPRERQQYQQQRQLQQHPLLNRPLPPQPPPDEPVSPALAAIQRFVFAWASPQRIPHALDRAFQAAADPLQQAPPPKQGQDASDADAHSSSNSSSRNRWPLASPAASTLASQFADAWTRETATAIAAARHPSVMASTARTHWRLLVTVACLHLFTVACELGGLLLLALAVSRLGAPPLDTLESTRTLGALWPAVLAALIFGVRALLFSQQRFIASALKSRMATALSSAILSAATRVLVHVTPVPSTQVLAWVRSAAPAIGNGVTVLPILLLAPFELAAQLAVIACGFGAAGSVTAILVVVFVRAAALYARRAAKSTEMSAVANGRANLAAAEAEARQGARSIKINSWQPYIATRLRALAHAHFSTLTRLARKSALAASALSVTYPLALLVSVAAAQIAGNAVPPSAWTRVVAGLYFLCQTLSRIEFDTREVLRMRGACTTELTEFLVHGQEWPVFNTASEITSDTRPAQLMGSALPFSDAAYVVPDSNAILSIHGFSLSTATTAAVVAPPGGLDPGVLLAALAGELQTTTMPVATAPGTTSRGTTRSQASTLARSTAVSAAATGAPTGAAKGTTPNYLTGYVSTQPSVVPGTVRSNIVFGHPSASTMPDNDPWLARVAAVCGLDRVSAALPRGLDTLTSNLPRYIAARIAVARAVYARPSILLLDMAAFIGEDGDTRLSAETLRDIFAATALVPSAATLIAIQDLAAARSFADAVAIVQNDGHVSTPVSWDAARVTMERDAMSRAPLGGGNMSAADPEALWLSTFVAACRTRTLSNGISSSIPASSATLAGSSIPRSRSETHSGSIMTTGSIASSVGTMSRLAAQFSRGASAPSKLARNATVTSDTVSLIGSDDGVALQGSDPLTLVAAACLVPDDGRSPSSNKGIGVWASLSAMASFCLDADPHVLYLATVPVSLLVVYAASAAAAWSASTWTAAANTTMMVGWVAGLLAIAIVAAVAGSLACAHIAVHACEAGKVGDIQRTVDAPLQWHSTQARPPNGECAWDQIAMQLPQMALQLPVLLLSSIATATLLIVASPWTALAIPVIVVAWVQVFTNYALIEKRLDAVLAAHRTALDIWIPTTLLLVPTARALRATAGALDTPLLAILDAQRRTMLARAGVASRRSLLIDVAASALVLLTGVIMAVALPSPDMGALLVLTTLYLCSLAAEAPEVAYANMILAQAIGGAITAQRQIPCESLAWLSSASALALRAAQEQQHGLTGVESIPADWPTTGSLSLRGVSVPRSKSTAGIRGWSLEACARDDFGILGEGAGSGLFTFVDAVLALVPTSGQVLLDGVAEPSVGVLKFRKQFAVVPRDPWVTTTTVRAMLDPECANSDDQLWDVLYDVGLGARVEEEPLKLDAPILSQDRAWTPLERRFLYLARALVSQARVIIVEDDKSHPTADLDKVLKMARTLVPPTSALIILTTRVDPVIECHHLAVVDGEGTIAETGAPYQVLLLGGAAVSAAGVLVPGPGHLRRHVEALGTVAAEEMWERARGAWDRGEARGATAAVPTTAVATPTGWTLDPASVVRVPQLRPLGG